MSPRSRTVTRLQFVQKSIEFNKWQRAVTTEPIINTRSSFAAAKRTASCSPGAQAPGGFPTHQVWSHMNRGHSSCCSLRLPRGPRNPLLALRLDKSSPNYTCLWAHPCLTPISQILDFFFNESQFYAVKFTSTVYNLMIFDRLHL